MRKKAADATMFEVGDEQVADDVGADVLEPGSRKGKLIDFADWLYGKTTQRFDPESIRIRLAPSIITRSESELLGISSPRFAFRAYLGSHGFVSIRRRKCIERHIVAAHGEDDFGWELIGYAADDKCNWLADCLLRPPSRLEDYTILTCDLSSDYGEEISKLVPFVTHADFGGGLCAQAACFMALCLSPCQQILGISEITSEAMRNKSDDDPVQDPNAFRVRGLSAFRINSFFKSCGKYGVGSQLQHCSLESNNASKRICHAVRTYLMNGMPVLQLVSLARMLGIKLPNEPHFEPVIQCTDQPAQFHEPHRIPVGFTLPGADGESEKASHCVLVVGCSNEGFIVNDPATFPFLVCSDKQLTAICAYDNVLEMESGAYDLNDVPLVPVSLTRREDIQATSPLGAPSLFVAISVTAADVMVPLLDPGREPMVNKKNETARVGLFNAINGTLLCGTATGLRSADIDVPPCTLGEIFLTNVGQAGMWASPRDGLPQDFDCRAFVANKSLAAGKYWVHATTVVECQSLASDGTAEHLDSLWFWDAKIEACAYSALRVVFVRRSDSWKVEFKK